MTGTSPYSMAIFVWGAMLPLRGTARTSMTFPQGTFRDGAFLVTFAVGRLTVRGERFIKARANYSVKGGEIEIAAEGASACTATGKYKWAFDGNVMSFTKIVDGCQGRVHHLTSRQWPGVKLKSPAK